MEPITPRTRLQPVPDVLFSRVGDEAVLLNVKSGMYYALDQIGVLVWTWSVEGQALGEIQAALSQQFVVELDVLWADLLALVRVLGENGLVTMSHARDVTASAVPGK